MVPSLLKKLLFSFMDPNSKGFGAIFTGSEVMRGPDTELESEPESEARAGY